MNEFLLNDESNVERKAQLITIIENDEKEYAVYSIDRDMENSNVFVSRLSKDSSGNDILLDIEDENERETIKKLVREVINLPLVGGE